MARIRSAGSRSPPPTTRYGGDKPVITLAGFLLGDELAVLGTISTPTSFGGAAVPADKNAETVWLGRWAVADGSPRGSSRIASSVTGDARPVAAGAVPGGALWYLSQTGLHIITAGTGGELSHFVPGAQVTGAYDIPNGRWYSATQGTLVCSEAH